MSSQYRLLVGGMPGVGLGGWVGDPLGLAPVPVYPVVAQGPVEGRLLDRLQIGAALMPQAMRPELAPEPLLGPRAGAADHVADGHRLVGIPVVVETAGHLAGDVPHADDVDVLEVHGAEREVLVTDIASAGDEQDRKSTRLNSSHVRISYAVFCLK